MPPHSPSKGGGIIGSDTLKSLWMRAVKQRGRTNRSLEEALPRANEQGADGPSGAEESSSLTLADRLLQSMAMGEPRRPAGRRDGAPGRGDREGSVCGRQGHYLLPPVRILRQVVGLRSDMQVQASTREKVARILAGGADRACESFDIALHILRISLEGLSVRPWARPIIALLPPPHSPPPSAQAMLSALGTDRAAAHKQGSGTLFPMADGDAVQTPPRRHPRAAPAGRLLGRKITIVAIHGWVPTKVLQSVIGVPRGTSAHLSRMMKEAVEDFVSLSPLAFFETKPDIATIALESSGCISDRVEAYLDCLAGEEGRFRDTSGHIQTGYERLAESDSIIFVAHSQGAPVAALLAARLLEQGTIRPDGGQNVAVLTLAAVLEGPFRSLEENVVVKYVEADAARELFTLSDAKSALRRSVGEAMTGLLDRNVRLACIGSWMDPVVPLYSSMGLSLGNHPNIWRAIYIDSHYYRPDFLTHLVTVGLKLTNANVQGASSLIAHLSDALEGSLYQSNSHSTLYDDETNVYPSVIHWMLVDDRDVGFSHPVEGKDESKASTREDGGEEANLSNPYQLPWIVRGILSNEKLMRHDAFKEDLALLGALHRTWNPDRKQWKLLKMQLASIATILPEGNQRFISDGAGSHG